MKRGNRILTVLLVGFLLACNGENAPDCFQNTGSLIREEISLPSFTKITVFENVTLVIKQGLQQKVEIETGSLLRNEVSATVVGDRLLLRDTNDCNYFRAYGTTKVFVTAPDLNEIRSSTGWPIESDGVLAYPELSLFSESFLDPEALTTDGSFDLELNNQNLNVVVNGIAYFKLSGNTENLNLIVAAGDSRVEAEQLIAQSVTIDHRGSNDLLIQPLQSLKGVIRGTGNVLSYFRPAVVEVDILYIGRLEYKD
ncbi:MAG: head GIN domain-containing protein [Flavobacteriaceae bacterium]